MDLNIVVYMILNTIIMNLLANSSYKKYIKIISSMILFSVIAPLMNIMELNDTIDFYLASNNLAVETSESNFALS